MSYKIPAFKDIRGYTKAVMSIPMMEPSEKVTKERLVESHLKLVVSLASNYASSGFLDDLIQEGNIALIKAADTYDQTMNVSFAAYAIPSIRYAIIHAHMEQFSQIKTLTTKPIRKAFFNLPKYLKDGEQLTSSVIERMVNDLKISEEDIRGAYERKFVSYEPINYEDADDDYFMLQIPASDDYQPDRMYEEFALSDFISKALDKDSGILNDREIQILNMRYLDDEPKTLKEISEVFSISAERVRQIDVSALKKIRKSLDVSVV